MKFGQLINRNMRKLFLEKYDGEASPRPFPKKSKLSTSLDQLSEMFQFLIVCPSEGLPKLRC